VVSLIVLVGGKQHSLSSIDVRKGYNFRTGIPVEKTGNRAVTKSEFITWGNPFIRNSYVSGKRKDGADMGGKKNAY